MDDPDDVDRDVEARDEADEEADDKGSICMIYMDLMYALIPRHIHKHTAGRRVICS